MPAQLIYTVCVATKCVVFWLQHQTYYYLSTVYIQKEPISSHQSHQLSFTTQLIKCVLIRAVKLTCSQTRKQIDHDLKKLTPLKILTKTQQKKPFIGFNIFKHLESGLFSKYNTNTNEIYIAPGILKKSGRRRMEWLDGKGERKKGVILVAIWKWPG